MAINGCLMREIPRDYKENTIDNALKKIALPISDPVKMTSL